MEKSGKRKRQTGTQEINPKSSSHDQNKRKKKNKNNNNSQQIQQKSSSSTPKHHLNSKQRKISGGGSNFLDKMRARLAGGHFRMINEKLYTCSGNEALDYFKEDPSLFNMYHTGYQEQMSHWPEQPVNIIIKWLKDRSPSLTVADFGCGDARLSKNVKNKVFSIDLVSNDPSVIACDMSNVPLLDVRSCVTATSVCSTNWIQRQILFRNCSGILPGHPPIFVTLLGSIAHLKGSPLRCVCLS